jgi:enoyl-CoA hydratase/carnithine racemase
MTPETDSGRRVEVTEVDLDSVLVEHRDRIALLTLNRPLRRNAWTYPMGNRYFDLLDELDDDPDVAAAVVTGAEGHFCVGMDGASLSETTQGLLRRPAKGRRMTHAMEFRKPLLAAIVGSCAGFGLVQALHCDLRFAGESSIFSTAFVRRGLNAEYGSSWLLPRIVGHAWAADLLLSARKVTAVEALSIGLVHRLLPDGDVLDAALAYASELAQWCSPTAMADAKMQYNHDWDLDRMAAEDRAKTLAYTPGHRVDFAEGVASLVGKRPPKFAPLPPRRDLA